MGNIKLIALDLDGTLFDDHGDVTPASIEAINYAVSKGVKVVISTGRPYSGIPFAQLKGTDIQYAITTNGGSVYRLDNRECIFEAPIPDEISLPIIEFLLGKEIHIAAFVDGDGVSPETCRSMISNLVVPESVKKTLFTTRVHVPDLISYIKKSGHHVQKVTLNVQKDGKGGYLNRDEIEAYLMNNPQLEVVCGGYHNLEFTRKGIDKGVGLRELAAYLGIDPSETMAVGDTGNDLAILEAAGTAVAMGNAIDEIKACADYVTASNSEDGVAQAIYHFV